MSSLLLVRQPNNRIRLGKILSRGGRDVIVRLGFGVCVSLRQRHRYASADVNTKINKLLGVELHLVATRLVSVLGFEAVCDAGLRLGEFVGSYNGIRKTM